jgi:ribose 5-phosphate isomerase A
MSTEAKKRAAAERALELVRPGMRLGLGTGSTAALFVDLLGRAVAGGLDVVCVPTSEATRARAEALSIPLATLDEIPELDLTVDGADEIDAELRLLKGGGGALLREKIVAFSSARLAIIADVSKQVDVLGAFPLPVEIVRFGAIATRGMVQSVLAEAGCPGEVRFRADSNGDLFLTDGDNLILDCDLGRITDPELLDEALRIVPGVVEHGLFLGLADIAFIADSNGVQVLESE